MQNRLYLYHIEKTKVLGPGYRLAIWTQGCNKRCKGCIATDSWDRDKGGYYKFIDEIVSQIDKDQNIDGVTISGGEPFLQNIAILELLQKLVKLRKLNIIIYSGYSFEELQKDDINRKIFEYVDLLIDGEYIEELNNDTPLAGSSNQNIIILSDIGYQLAQIISTKKGRDMEFVIKNQELFIIGVPPKKLNLTKDIV
jgi:anaerobic ribonucleoside-triphosphate reductase activating protein